MSSCGLIIIRITESLTLEHRRSLDNLVEVDENRLSPLQALKETPKRASPQAMLRLLEKLEKMESIGVLTVDLSWLNNNYQWSLTHYAKRCSANRLRALQPDRRYAVLVCFLWQTYRGPIDYAVDMHDKIMNNVYSQAEKEPKELLYLSLPPPLNGLLE